MRMRIGVLLSVAALGAALFTQVHVDALNACGVPGADCCNIPNVAKCAPGLNCENDNKCRAPQVCGAVGMECCAGNNCGPGLACENDHKCRIPPACGLPGIKCCDGVNACAPGLQCQSGKCAAAIPIGFSCVDGVTTCETGARCIVGRCTHVGNHGEECDASGNCNGTLQCWNHWCTNPGEQNGSCRPASAAPFPPCNTGLACNLANTCVDPNAPQGRFSGIATGTAAKGTSTPPAATVAPAATSTATPTLAPVSCSASNLCSSGICYQGYCRTQPRGQSCTYATDCRNQTSCSKPTPSSTTGTCEFVGGYFQVCGMGGACSDGAECRDNQCAPVGYQNEPCTRASTCYGVGLSCISGQCRHVGNLGEPCAPNGSCSQGACRFNVCSK